MHNATEVKAAAETTGQRSSHVLKVAGSVNGQAGTVKSVVEQSLGALVGTPGRSRNRLDDKGLAT